MEEPKHEGDDRDEQSRRQRMLLSNPLRRRIARLLAEGKEATATELAREFDAPTGQVAHHLELLRRAGALLGASKRDGSPRRYRWGPDEDWAREALADDDEEEEGGER